MAPTGSIVSKATAKSNGWKLGDAIEADFAATGTHALRVAGIYADKGWIADNFILSLEARTSSPARS